MRPISNDIMTYLAKKCATINELMDSFNKNTDISDFFCEEWSKLVKKVSGTILKNISDY